MEKPSLPKGTRDFGPPIMARRHYIFNAIRQVFQQFGFLPLETPAMENLSTLMGKYGDEGDQLLFKVLNSGDYLKEANPDHLRAGDSKKLTPSISEKGLRYDLTVPFARFVVMNRQDLALPFKRYQMQPVWRADRPQKGRYREFYQCDADVVGTDSMVCEAEIILMIKSVFHNLGITDFTININHRDILAGLASLIGAGGKEGALFVALDKLDKIGEGKVREELRQKGFGDESLDLLFAQLNLSFANRELLETLKNTFASQPVGGKGIQDLTEVFDVLEAYGDDGGHVRVDTSLARGLSYYTGMIVEVKINGVAIGSVSGGGRYDNLVQAFGSHERLSGVGISFGVDRLYDAMEELQLFPTDLGVSTQVLICHLDVPSMRYGVGVLSALRKAGVSVELYPDPSKLKKQLDYANKKNIPFTVVIGEEEMTSGLLAFKDMGSGEQKKLSIEGIMAQLKP